MYLFFVISVSPILSDPPDNQNEKTTSSASPTAIINEEKQKLNYNF